MKYQHASELICGVILMLSMICFPLTASAAIVKTELVFYDLATASQRSYAMTMQQTPGGAQVTLHRSGNIFPQSIDIATCFNAHASAKPEEYLQLKENDTQQIDPALVPYLNFTRDNRLRMAMTPLANAQTLLLDRDTLNVLVVDPAMMTIGAAGCQR